jgi:citronellol/citronellal dehydrogenase
LNICFGMSLAGRVAIVTGSSRGIGRECVLALARQGANVVVCAKSTQETPNLPGSIHTVAAEAEALGVQSLPYQIDLRDAEQAKGCVEAAVSKWGRCDILVNNASALWWQSIEETPMNKYDLINGLNARGSFAMAQACMPHMLQGGYGRVINMSPPIVTSIGAYAQKTAYNISKMGMTMVALGVAAEGRGKGVSGHSLWPATIIESQASINFKLGDPSGWRKATILADCVTKICAEPDDYTGHMLIDDEYLRDRHGFTDEDLKQYRVDPDVDPPRLLATENQDWAKDLRRGDVRKVAHDTSRSAI